MGGNLVEQWNFRKFAVSNEIHMEKIQVNIKDVLSMVPQANIDSLKGCAATSLSKLVDGTGLGNDFLGWVKLPGEVSAELLEDIVATAASLR